MATKAKTAQGEKGKSNKRACPTCPGEVRVVQFAGFGKKGFYWTCEKDGCGYIQRTR